MLFFSSEIQGRSGRPKKWIGKHDEIFAIYTTDISATLEWIASTVPIPRFLASVPPVQLRRSVIARSQTTPEEILRQTGTTHGLGDKWDFPTASWPGYYPPPPFPPPELSLAPDPAEWTGWTCQECIACDPSTRPIESPQRKLQIYQKVEEINIRELNYHKNINLILRMIL